ncbi:hypothetical protein [Flavobacterium luminosum]|uniref:Uncharacterized protein n=1 Tax=Flavobacterium luminosum TaxID=2949086 RepID=A0ABT0TT89_9FLAO|nr:hypothetical protein [Flavobacterium sp. HXWNR70]MCL9810088.1 hypothetical protein [Flavobacterium sp. HXWNR70]
MDFTSVNLDELQELQRLLHYFDYSQQSFLDKIENRIQELLELKEASIKENDFVKANDFREEINSFHELKKSLK